MADAQVAILTPGSIGSNSVWAEMGATRILTKLDEGTALLPVLIGIDSPDRFVADMFSLSYSDYQNPNIDEIVTDIDTGSARAHRGLAADQERAGWPRIFISHRHRTAPSRGH